MHRLLMPNSLESGLLPKFQSLPKVASSDSAPSYVGFFFLSQPCQLTIQWNKCMCTALCLYCQDQNNGFSDGWSFQQTSLTKTGPLQDKGEKSFFVNPWERFVCSSSYTGYKLVYCLFVFISAIIKTKSHQINDKNQSIQGDPIPFLILPLSFPRENNG